MIECLIQLVSLPIAFSQEEVNFARFLHCGRVIFQHIQIPDHMLKVIELFLIIIDFQSENDISDHLRQVNIGNFVKNTSPELELL